MYIYVENEREMNLVAELCLYSVQLIISSIADEVKWPINISWKTHCDFRDSLFGLSKGDLKKQ